MRYAQRVHKQRAHLRCGVLWGVSLLAASGCGGPVGPTVSTRKVVSLEIFCPTGLRVGESGSCFAQAHYSDGSAVNPAAATWSSSDPSVATIVGSDFDGRMLGRGPGQVVISGHYGEGSATTLVSITAEDFLKVTSAGVQGLFQTGRTVTMTVIGAYGVASAGTAQSGVEITDQAGNLIVGNAPQTVAKGGDSFVLSRTFVIPSSASKVCRTAVLQIGDVRLTAVGSDALFPCIDILR